MTYRSPQDFAQDTSVFRRAVASLIRRFVVTLSSGTRWQFLGHRGANGEPDEVVELEIFPGIGFFSRPPTSGKPEAISVALGSDVKSSTTRVAIATRDEKTRQAVAGDLAADEAIVYNSVGAQLRVKADGTVEIRLAGGVAVPLATKADVQAAVDKFNNHAHGGVSAGAGFSTGPVDGTLHLPISIPNPTGTTVLKGQ